LILFINRRVLPRLQDQFGFIPFITGFGQADFGPNSKGKQLFLSHELVLHPPVLAPVRVQKQEKARPSVSFLCFELGLALWIPSSVSLSDGKLYPIIGVQNFIVLFIPQIIPPFDGNNQ